jgi:hypothetical protein
MHCGDFFWVVVLYINLGCIIGSGDFSVNRLCTWSARRMGSREHREKDAEHHPKGGGKQRSNVVGEQVAEIASAKRETPREGRRRWGHEALGGTSRLTSDGAGSCKRFRCISRGGGNLAGAIG